MHSRKVIVIFGFMVLLAGISSQLCPSAYSTYDKQPDVCSTSASVVSQYQNVTHEGDMMVSGNETFTIQDSEFYMIGKITLTDTSALVIRDSQFVTIPSWGEESIVLEEQASLAIINSTVIFQHPGGFGCEITAYHSSQVNITISTVQKHGYFVAFNSSSVHVRNSTMTFDPKGPMHYCGVATHGTSIARIENSNVDGVFVWGNSSTSIENSVVGIIRTEPNTAVNITSSELKKVQGLAGSPEFHIEHSAITWRLTLGYNASAWLTSCSIAEISAFRNASVFLIDSSAAHIKTKDNATVLVGWNLPLFGLVMMHYTLVPILQASIVMISIAIVVIFLVYLFRKTRRKRAPGAPAEAT